MKSIIWILIFLSLNSWAQDERSFRQMVTGELTRDRQQDEKQTYKFQTRSDRYQIDLNGDGTEESFFTAKRDGEDWIYFFNSKREEFFKFRFDTLGYDSRIFKIQKRKLSKDVDILLVYFFEGVTNFLEFEGTARIYFFTMKDANLKTIKAYKGPYIWQEHKSFKNYYKQRSSDVTLFDFDDDGTREVAVRYNLITRVFKFSRLESKWTQLEGGSSISGMN